jgi:hypothetical protein
MLLAVFLSVGATLLGGTNASAAPAAGTLIAKMADRAGAQIKLAAGCLRGWYRGPRGRCQPN